MIYKYVYLVLKDELLFLSHVKEVRHKPGRTGKEVFQSCQISDSLCPASLPCSECGFCPTMLNDVLSPTIFKSTERRVDGNTIN